MVYTDRYQVYDALMFCGYRHLRVDHDRRFSRGKVHINGLEGFWAYAKERLIKHHGVSKERFPLYLKEMEFRYNHRHQDLFPLARISHHPLGGWIIGCELGCFFLSVAFAVEPGPVGGWS